jgi:uncharacterized SAM-binding protein YcdF (DUF218 family)
MKKLRLALLFIIAVAALAIASGPMLVSDHPEKSDVIVVLGGDRNEIRYKRAVELLRAGYGQRLLLDADVDWTLFGRTEVEYATEFLQNAPEDIRARVQVCPYTADSTYEETEDVVRCLRELHAQSALIVTSTYHTRRALSTFRKREPGYRWSSTGASDPVAWGPRWWRHRQWAKTHLGEWERMIWWQMVDRWRA